MTVFAKSRLSWGARLAGMNEGSAESPGTIGSGDFAVVGIHGGTVVLEANEWDVAMGAYRVVTLYLNPADARKVAEQLHNCAAGADHDGDITH